MRVLMYGWEFPPHISGGLGTACFGLTKGLSGLDVQILFVIPRIEGEPGPSHVHLLSASDVTNSKRPPIEIRTVRSRLKPYLNARPYHIEITREYTPYIPAISYGGGPSGLYGAELFDEVTRYGQSGGALAKREKFDIIHSHDWMTVVAGRESRRVSGRPWIYHVHSLEFDRNGEDVHPRIYEIEKSGLEEADHVIAVSQYTKDAIVQRYRIDPARITVVHNAVAEFGGSGGTSKERKEKIVLFLGRVTFQKGPDYFVEAASRILKCIPDVTFVMAGDGDLMPRMIERVAELGIGSRFRFTGFLRDGEVEEMFARSDVYVMPSVSEPFGIAPLEAMLRNVPVILSRQSGVSEILHHALKVDFWNVNDLADRIIAVLRYPVLAKEMADRSREEIAAVQWSAAAEKILSVYRKVCG